MLYSWLERGLVLFKLWVYGSQRLLVCYAGEWQFLLYDDRANWVGRSELPVSLILMLFLLPPVVSHNIFLVWTIPTLCLWRMCNSLIIGVVPVQGANGRIMMPSVCLLIVMKPSIIQLTWHCSLVGSLRRWRTDDGTFWCCFCLCLSVRHVVLPFLLV